VALRLPPNLEQQSAPLFLSAEMRQNFVVRAEHRMDTEKTWTQANCLYVQALAMRNRLNRTFSSGSYVLVLLRVWLIRDCFQVNIHIPFYLCVHLTYNLHNIQVVDSRQCRPLYVQCSCRRHHPGGRMWCSQMASCPEYPHLKDLLILFSSSTYRYNFTNQAHT